jgi:ribonuclease HI
MSDGTRAHLTEVELWTDGACSGNPGQRNGWTTADKQPVKNRELWQQLLAEAARHEIEWVKVTGHSGVKLNERVDRLACAERDRQAERIAATAARR